MKDTLYIEVKGVEIFFQGKKIHEIPKEDIARRVLNACCDYYGVSFDKVNDLRVNNKTVNKIREICNEVVDRYYRKEYNKYSEQIRSVFSEN